MSEYASFTRKLDRFCQFDSLEAEIQNVSQRCMGNDIGRGLAATHECRIDEKIEQGASHAHSKVGSGVFIKKLRNVRRIMQTYSDRNSPIPQCVQS